MERSEWLEARRKCITGTDIGAIVGISPYRTPMDVYCDKLGLTEDLKDNPAMDWGRRLEGAVAQRYADDTGLELAAGEWTVRDGWMGATPDRLIVGAKKGLEVKTAGFRSAKLFGESGTDQIPDWYALQCHWYMAVTDRDEWDLAVLINGSDYRTYNLKRSIRIENRLIELATKFREQHILAQVPPKMDGSSGAEAYLRAVFPKNKGSDLLAATPEIETLATKLAGAKANLELIETEIAEVENLLKNAIGEAPGVAGETWKITWRANKDSVSTDWKGVASALSVPREVLEKYTVTKPGARRFLFTVNKQ